jgi:1,4-dihydroxy-2-naphthoyl-CoA hydrolase
MSVTGELEDNSSGSRSGHRRCPEILLRSPCREDAEVPVEQARSEQASADAIGKHGDAMQAEVSSPDGTAADRMGIKILELSAERVVGAMRVAGGDQSGAPVYAGASCLLAETLAWSGSAAHGGPERAATVIEISATHHRTPADGGLTGVATRVHGGRTLATYRVEITGSRGQRVCTAQLTCLLRDRPAGSAETGTAR